jgi:hypothetical protein
MLEEQLKELAKTTYLPRDGGTKAEAVYEHVRKHSRINLSDTPPPRRPDLENARNWVTTVEKDGNATKITAEVELKASLAKLRHMVDPRRWAENSVFWYKSEPIDAKGNPAPALDAKGNPVPALKPLADDPGLPPPYWEGRLLETVAGMSLYTTYLNINYHGTPGGDTLVEYSLDWTPDNIEVDEGSVRISPPKDDGWVKGVVTKKVDFTNNPYGGPSTADLIAPSYLGSWLRVQQDLWIALATEQAIRA